MARQIKNINHMLTSLFIWCVVEELRRNLSSLRTYRKLGIGTRQIKNINIYISFIVHLRRGACRSWGGLRAAWGHPGAGGVPGAAGPDQEPGAQGRPARPGTPGGGGGAGTLPPPHPPPRPPQARSANLSSSKFISRIGPNTGLFSHWILNSKRQCREIFHLDFLCSSLISSLFHPY